MAKNNCFEESVRIPQGLEEYFPNGLFFSEINGRKFFTNRPFRG